MWLERVSNLVIKFTWWYPTWILRSIVAIIFATWSSFEIDLFGYCGWKHFSFIGCYLQVLHHWNTGNWRTWPFRTLYFLVCHFPIHCLNLHSLSLYRVFMSNASMEKICRSSLASQLTKLSLIFVSTLSLEAYHLIVHSFPRLQVLNIDLLPVRNQTTIRDHIRNIVQWLDELFSRQCVFANTVETISLIIFIDPQYYLDWTVKENATFANELFQDHMLKQWHFPFPSLQSFAMIWRISHPHMSGLMVGRLLNCTKLHNI